MKTYSEMNGGTRGRDDPRVFARGRVLPAAISCGVLVVLIVAVSQRDRWIAQPPPCLLKLVTGIPCPGCGGTRALDALSRGEIGQAFALSPLVVGGCGLLLGWLAFALFSPAVPVDVRRAAGRWLGRSRRPLTVLGVILALMHWVYLVVFH